MAIQGVTQIPHIQQAVSNLETDVGDISYRVSVLEDETLTVYNIEEQLDIGDIVIEAIRNNYYVQEQIEEIVTNTLAGHDLI